MSGDPGLQRWLDHMAGDRDTERLEAMLAENAVFHSPVVHTPQRGRALCFAYLHAADRVFAGSGFEYVRTIVEGDDALLEFTAEIDGIHINDVDIIRWNADGLIADFKVMVRPLKAINLLWEKMAAALKTRTPQ